MLLAPDGVSVSVSVIVWISPTGFIEIAMCDYYAPNIKNTNTRALSENKCLLLSSGNSKASSPSTSFEE